MTVADASLLVVDDNEGNRYTLTRRLAREGYTNITTANDGRQALELLHERPFDLVLLDIMMPEMDGYQVLEHVKADKVLRDIPVIMISALEEMDSVIRCVQLGAEDYLAKPFNPTLLRARVGSSLEKKRLRDQVRASLQRLEEELETARKLQFGMLPSAFPEWSLQQPVQVQASMETAREVGGDLYDFFYATERRFWFLIGDVSGKGAPAAMFMARTRSLVRLAVTLWQRIGTSDPTPAQIAEAVNTELCKDNRERMFVTVFLGCLDTRTGVLTYTNAGHPAPYLLRSMDIQSIEGKPHAPIGVRSNTVYRNCSMELEPGDGLFVCTDGVAEAMNLDDEFYTEERLRSRLRAARKLAPAALLRTMSSAVESFCAGADKADDIAMLALRWIPGCSEQASASDGSAVPIAHVSTGIDCNEDSGVLPVEVCIRNDLAQLDELTSVLDRFGRDNDIAQATLFQLQVVLDEMVSNVIKYAWPEGGDHAITVRFSLNDETFGMVIVDDGRPFNPLHAAMPQRPPPGQRPQPGNLGIHMVKKLVDSIEYARIDERNQLSLTKRCAPARPLNEEHA